MTTLPEIQTTIRQLPENEILQLAAWLRDYLDVG